MSGVGEDCSGRCKCPFIWISSAVVDGQDLLQIWQVVFQDQLGGEGGL